MIRNSEDCTLSGLHITNVWRGPGGLLLENCRRMNVTHCTILDCDNAGLLLKNVTDSRVSDCLIRDDRPDANSVSVEVTLGSGNMIVSNLLGTRPRTGENVGYVTGNVHP